MKSRAAYLFERKIISLGFLRENALQYGTQYPDFPNVYVQSLRLI